MLPLTIIFILALSPCLGSRLTEILNQWENAVINQEKANAQKLYQSVKYNFDDSTNQPEVNRRILRTYAQYLMYGLDEDYAGHIDYTRVFYYAKQAADMGDPAALTILGVLGSMKLDGGFNLNSNLELKHPDLDNMENFRRLEQFVKYHHLSTSLIDLYFASVQGDDQASLMLAYKYMKGLGVQANCSNSALFLNQILEKHFIEQPLKDKVIFQNRRIDHIIYNTEVFSLGAKWLDQEHVHIFEHIDLVTRDSVVDVIILAYNYLYGINGVKRNYNKAYELFTKATQDVKNPQAMAFAAKMIVEGIAPVNDMDLAFQLFSDSAAQNDSRGLNGLGYMYLHGLGTEKDLRKAMKYFLKSAELGNSDGQYNYGSMHMMPSTLDHDRNKRIGFSYLNQASTQGHAMAQYALALIYLDGVDFYYSCELAIKLMHQATTRLEVARNVKHGNELFVKGRYPQSFANYLQSALLGYDSALVNSAILALDFNAITSKDIQYDQLNEILLKDDLFKFAQNSTFNLIEMNDPFAYLFKDFISIAGSEYDELTYEEKYALVKSLMKLDNAQTKTIGQYVASKLLGYCKIEADGYCYLRYGDFFYNGIYEEQSYENAFSQYSVAAEAPETPTVVQAHAYFNLGYMVSLGLGKPQNLTLAHQLFNASLTKHPFFPGMNADILLSLSQLYGDDRPIMMKLEPFLERAQEALIKRFEIYRKPVLGFFLTLTLIFLWGVKLKVSNMDH